MRPKRKMCSLRMNAAVTLALLALTSVSGSCKGPEGRAAESIPLPEEVVALYGEAAAYRAGDGPVRIDVAALVQKSAVKQAVVVPFDDEHWYEPSRVTLSGTTITADAMSNRNLLVVVDLGDVARNNYQVLSQMMAINGLLPRELRPRICTQILCPADRFQATSLPERVEGLERVPVDFGRVLPDVPIGSIGRPGTICDKCLDLGTPGNVLPCLVWGCGVPKWPVKRKIYVRRNIYALTAADVNSLRAGVAAMKARAATDPTSWLYQAKMHAINSGSIAALQDQCQHRQFFFFSWHRMFIYFFEKILRAASGNPNLALPYWNYTDVPGQGVLPEPFRIPADLTNALYNPTRSAVYNGGAALPPADVTYSGGFSLTNFTTATLGSPSFGGRTVAAPAHFPSSGGTGRIEQSPHNNVHNDISGEMATGESPRDPIFWLHHANIDRLWKRWIALAGGRDNPTADATWMNQTFTFFDENGAQVPMTGAQILDTVAQLNYRYDDDPLVLWPRFWPYVDKVHTARESQIASSAEVLARIRRSVRLTDRRQDVPIALPQPARARLAESRKTNFASERVVLQLRDIEYDQPVGVTYLLFLNLPDGARNPDHTHPNFIGTLGFFGKTDTGAAAAGLVEEYDVTAVVQRLNTDSLQLAVIPSYPSAPSDRKDLEALIARLKPQGNPRFGEVAVIREQIKQ